jgi:hypothetical protein
MREGYQISQAVWDHRRFGQVAERQGWMGMGLEDPDGKMIIFGCREPILDDGDTTAQSRYSLGYNW